MNKSTVLIVILLVYLSILVGCGIKGPHHANYGSNCTSYGCHTKKFILKHDLGFYDCDSYHKWGN